MNKKKLIAKLLDKLSEEDLMELLGDEPEQEEEQQTFNTHIHSTRSDGSSSNRRKGRGQSKSKANATNKKRKSKRGGKSRGSRGKSCRVLPIDTDLKK